MVIGIGTDVVEIERIRGSVEKFGDRFLKKLFTDREMEYCNSKADPVIHYSGRFAAKESIIKALSHLYKGPFAWTEIEILNESDGVPKVFLHDRLSGVLPPGAEILVSLSHSHTVASGFSILQQGKI